ncbi:SpvB/TcaC N-terminal domain-containing protein [Flavobacterium sp.]|jgi:RHS repeat-associated protein|uniref:SpvB/TcaC N-terminal domain-containing protein n=1 Tax=Flavobacterium sp. TaxID=239 RepID=UPI0037C10E4E
MENRTKILGINRKTVIVFNRIALIAMLHSTFVAPSQSMIQDVYGAKEKDYYGYIGSSQLVDTNDKIASKSNTPNIIQSNPKSKLYSSNSLNDKLFSFQVDSDIKEGTIGVSNTNPLDDAKDNLFKFYIKDIPTQNFKTYLTYDLFGVQDFNAVSRSINDRPATGGYIVKNQKGWTSQREEINLNWLRVGENKILFGIPKGSNYQYQIKNVKLEFGITKGSEGVSSLILNAPSLNYSKDNQLYIKGFLKNYNSDVKVYAEDTPLNSVDGEYEGFLKLTDAIKNRKFVMVKAFDSKGLLGQELLSLDNLIEADKVFIIEESFKPVVSFVKARTSSVIKTEGASLKINDSALIDDKEISISKIRTIDIAPMSSGLVNVTQGGYGFRFLPDGTKFNKPVALEIAYDEHLIPKGHNANEIKTFYFNTQQKTWVAIERDTINKIDKTITSLTNHFTDYINGIIQTPESPETAGFTPTMMNDIKAADPSSEMTLISPPEVSQKGDANVSYPIKIPAGRKGMQPQLAVQYSNEGGNGWLGQGWNISTPAITIDTRWGVPTFNPTKESEIYTLNGEQLMYPKTSNGQDWMPNRHQETGGIYDTSPINRTANIQFTPRKQGSFAKIERLGSATTNYYWKVTNTDGTINWYGGDNTGINENAIIRIGGAGTNICHWALYMTQDVFGNCVKYEYDNTTIPTQSGQNANLNNGRIFHIKNIKYTGFNNANYGYEVVFNSTTTIRQDVSINARLGVKQVEPYLLKDIIVKKIDGRLPIRKYNLIYNPNLSKFKKSQLIAVAELDKDNKEFYRHTFEYYDDLADGNGNDVYFSNGVNQTICNDAPVTPCLDTDNDGVCNENDPCPTVAGPISNNGCPIDQGNHCYGVHFPAPRTEPGAPLVPVGIPTEVFIDGVQVPGGPFNLLSNPYAFSQAVNSQYNTFFNFGQDGMTLYSCILQFYGNHIFNQINLHYNGLDHFYNFNLSLNCSQLSAKQSVVNNNIENVDISKVSKDNLEKIKKDLELKNSITKSKNSKIYNKGLFPAGDYFHNLLGNHTISYQPIGNIIDPNCPPLYNSSFFINGVIPSFVSVGAILGSSTSKSINIGGHLGFGIDFEWNNGHKLMTIGGGYSHSWENSESLTALIDIDGDGLEDCVYKFNNRLYWKKHLVTRTYDTNNEPVITHSFSGLKNITSIDNSITDFYKSHGESSSYNIQLNAGFSGGSAIFGYDGSNNKSRSNVYFTDANGDGLTDIESYGTVYFNRIQGDIPFFEPESERTENMIIKARPNEITPPDEVLEDVTPAYDVVKVWEAPADGAIKIENTILNTDPSKEAILTIEMGKFVEPKCYSVTFPVPTSIFRDFNLTRSVGASNEGWWEYDRDGSENVSLKLTYLVGSTNYNAATGVFPSVNTNHPLFMSNGNYSGPTFLGQTFSYINANGINHNIISNDFVYKNHNVLNSLESVFPGTYHNSFTLYDAYQHISIDIGYCTQTLIDAVYYSKHLYSSNPELNYLAMDGYWLSYLGNGNLPYQCNGSGPNETPTPAWPITTSSGISTNIKINNQILPNSPLTLYQNSDFQIFKNYIESQYPGATVTLFTNPNAGSTITVTINNTFETLSTISLTSVNGNTTNTYNFSQINCTQNKSLAENTLSNNDDWKDYRFSKNELELIYKQSLANGCDLNELDSLGIPIQLEIENQKYVLKKTNKGIVWYDDKDALITDQIKIYKLNKNLTPEFLSNYSSLSDSFIDKQTKERKQAQKDAQDWLDEYYKKQNEENSQKVNDLSSTSINPTTCTFTPSEICKLYGIRLNGATTSVTNTLDKNCEGQTLKVKKGDRIYFRVHSISTGNPAVNWDPKVSYTETVFLNTLDQNGLKPYSSSYSDGFILSQSAPVTFPGNGTAQITWDNFNVNNPSDVVTFQIVKRQVTTTGTPPNNGTPILYQEDEIYTWTCQPGSPNTVAPTAALNAISASSTTNSLAQFLFRVRSTSNVNWKLFEWKPKVIFTTSQNITATVGGASEGVVTDAETKYPIVDYSIYKPFNCGSYYKTIDISSYNSSGLSIAPVITNSIFNNNDNGTLNFVVKRGNTLVGKRIIKVANGSVSIFQADGVTVATTPIPITGTGAKIEVGIYTDDSARPINHPTNVSLLFRLMNATTIATIMNGTTAVNVPASNVNLMHKPLSQFGSMYRQWGQFFYCPAKAANSIVDPTLGVKLIKEELLTITNAQATQLQTALENNTINQPPINVQDPAATTTLFNNLNTLVNQSGINNFPFMMANPVRSKDNSTIVEKWIGFHNENYATSTAFRAATLAQSYVFPSVTSITQGLYNTGAIGIDRVSRGSGDNITAGGGSGGFQASAVASLGGSSTTLTDYIDLNGDRYPDIVTTDRLQYTLKTGGLFEPMVRSIGGAMSDDNNGNWGLSASGTFSKAGKPIPADTAKRNGKDHIGKPGTFAFGGGGNSTGISGSLGFGENNTSRMWADVNGDGLPDIVKKSMNGSTINVSIDLNLGNNVFSAQNYWGNFSLAAGSSQTIGGGLGYNFANGSIEAGLSLGRTDSDTNNTLFDINGDGLLDKIASNGSSISVDYNLGNKFVSNFTQISNQFNYKNSAETVNSGINGTGTGAIIWPLYLLVITIPLKIPDVSITASLGSSTNRTKKTLTDFDGDGYPDFLEELSPGTVRVYHSRIRRTDMLKSVTNPLGGKFTIDYKVQPVDYNNSQAKWAMSDLQIEDGYDKVNDGKDVYKKHFIYENGKYDRREREFYGYETVKVQDYAMDADNLPTSVYRTSVSKYHNNSYFLNGLLKESYVLKGEDEQLKFSRTINNYQVRKLNNNDNNLIDSTVLPDNFDVGGTEGRRSAVVLLTSTINELYELNPSPQLTTQVRFEYDTKGRVVEYLNFGNIDTNSDDYTSKIGYHDDPALLNLNILNVPKFIKVSDASGLRRQRTTTVDVANGNIESISALISTGVEAQTFMKYDQYGNLNYIQYPENEAGQQMAYEYKYDPAYNKYIIGISDAFGYSSSATYNSDFDKILSTIDLAGNLMLYRYDSFGRTTLIRAPKETEASQRYTIRFEYFPIYANVDDSPYRECVDRALFTPFAITNHFDVQHSDNDIQTVTFIDGLGRPIQVKKDIQLNVGSPQEPNYIESMSISGKAWFDDFGRTIKQFHPYFEDKNCEQNYVVNEYESPFDSETVYDELDRPVKTLDPEDNSSTMEYSIETDVDGTMAIKTKSIVEQNGNQNIVTETFKDVSGKVISTKNQGTTDDLWTRFNYNAIGELLSYTDAEEITTGYEYDLLGRKTLVSHPDNGTTTYQYDDASNLIKLQTANLANDGSLDPDNRFIKYNYYYNRLVQIKYPINSNGSDNISNVYYKYGDTGNQTGRLIWQKDATGTQEFDYGNMGEMVSNVRTVVGPNIPTRVFKTSYQYDSWNRLQSMVYPDGETIAYNYDLGGNLNKMTGDYNGSPYSYINRIDYDYYEQRTYLLYGNRTETFYNYTPALRRLENLNVKTSDSNDLFNNKYQYDKVGNVLGLSNNAGVTANNMAGGYKHAFEYDNFNRLVKAEGIFDGSIDQIASGNDANAKYFLKMSYNKTHGIENKTQGHSKNGNTFIQNTYSNHYKYIADTHKVGIIIDVNTGEQENFGYDLNGNITKRTTNTSQRVFSWDESNRLRVVSDNSSMQHYIYDASGERVLKANSDMEAVYENGTLVNAPGTVSINGYTSYPSGFMVITADGVYSKHYYAGSQRIVSRLGDNDASMFETDCPTCKKESTANEFDSKELQKAQITDLQSYADKLKKGTIVYKDYKPIPLAEQEKALADENKTDNEENTAKLQRSGEARAPEVAPIYYYHPDHLGTSTALTDFNGNAYQFFLNLPFGETMAQQLGSNYYNSPYKFNGKELDEETGFYYYGARYYDPRISIWLSVDPLAEEYPNVSPYAYCLNNPINAIDPDGRRVYFVAGAGNDPASQGWNYKKRFKKIWESRGIKDVRLMNVSHGREGDMIFADAYRHYSKVPGSNSNMKVTAKMITKAVNGIMKDLKNNPLAEGEQMNLTGYSYGSVLQAHVAIALADKGVKVDNLILIGSPISDDSDLMKTLNEYKDAGKIGGIQRIDIEGDGFSNPKSNSEYLNAVIDALPFFEGDAHHHFDLARPGKAADKKIGEAADKLIKAGVE